MRVHYKLLKIEVHTRIYYVDSFKAHLVKLLMQSNKNNYENISNIMLYLNTGNYEVTISSIRALTLNSLNNFMSLNFQIGETLN